MVVIDTRTNKVYECVSKSEAGRIVGVDRVTIYRWSKLSPKQVYNHFELYYNVQRLKQKKGKPRTPPHQRKIFRRP